MAISPLFMVIVQLHITAIVQSNGQSVSANRFLKGAICKLDERLSMGCAKALPQSRRGLMGCLSKCEREAECVGVTMDSTGACIHHQECSLECSPSRNEDCTVPSNYWQKLCLHGHFINNIGNPCRCLHGTYGDRCDQYVNKCDGYGDTEAETVLVDFDRDMLNPMRVVCHRGAIRVAMNSGKINFNRSYEEYVDGFWVDEDNMWLGLDNLHLLNENGYSNIRISATFEDDAGMLSFHKRFYTNFTVQKRARDYFVTSVGNSNAYSSTWPVPPPGLMGDCLFGIQSVNFSTWDRDRDNVNENCALAAGNGWWFNGCHMSCNLLGILYGGDSPTPTRRSAFVAGIADSYWPSIVSTTIS